MDGNRWMWRPRRDLCHACLTLVAATSTAEGLGMAGGRLPTLLLSLSLPFSIELIAVSRCPKLR